MLQMENCVISTEICNPDGKVEKINVEFKEKSLSAIKTAVTQMQANINSILTEKMEAEKGKEPDTKKPKKE